MKVIMWNNRKPQSGDWLKVKLNGYDHHGVYLNDDRVVHYCSEKGFSILNHDMQVQETSLAVFCQNKDVQVREFSDEEKTIKNSKDLVEQKAISVIGEARYDFFFNNCEHLVCECFFNQRKSEYINNLITKGLQVRRKSGIAGFVDSFYVNLLKLQERK